MKANRERSVMVGAEEKKNRQFKDETSYISSICQLSSQKPIIQAARNKVRTSQCCIIDRHTLLHPLMCRNVYVLHTFTFGALPLANKHFIHVSRDKIGLMQYSLSYATLFLPSITQQHPCFISMM